MSNQPSNSTPSEFDPYHVWLSIAPDEQPPHHYRLLGLKPFESDLRVIESAADRQMAHVRTFQSGKYSKQSQQLLNEISAAKLCLLYEANKQAYDQDLKAALAEAAAAEKPVAKAAAKPAPLTAKPLPERAAPASPKRAAPVTSTVAPRAGEFAFVPNSRSDSRALASRRKPSKAIPAIVVFAVVVIAAVGFVVTRNNDTATAQHDSPTPEPPTVAPVEAKPHDDAIVTPQPPAESQTDQPQHSPATPYDPRDVGPQENPTDVPLTTPATPDDLASAVQNPTPPKLATDLPIERPDNTPDDAQVATNNKLPIPNAESLKDKEALAHQLFAADFSAAETTEAKSKLAVKLLGRAGDSGSGAVERFALMKMAYELAGDAGDVNLIADAIAALDEVFEVDTLQLRADAYLLANRQRRTGPELLEFTGTMLDVMAAATRADRYDVVNVIRDEIADNIRKISDIDAKKQIAARLKDSREHEKQFAAAERAREALNDDPADAASHLVLGEYLCFVKRDWENGLPHLAAGSDTDLKKLAENDIANPTSAKDQTALADAWWEFAENERRDKAAKIAQWARAVFWYEQALPSLAGLHQEKVQQRLDEFAATGAEKGGGNDRAAPRPAPKLQGRLAWIPNVPAGTGIYRLQGHTDMVHAVAVSPDGRLAASTSMDKTVRLWDLANNGKLLWFTPDLGKGGRIQSVKFSPSGSILDVRFVSHSVVLLGMD